MQKEFWQPSGSIFFRHPHTAPLINGIGVFTLTLALSNKWKGRYSPSPQPSPLKGEGAYKVIFFVGRGRSEKGFFGMQPRATISSR
jgi:hypothetical protein